MCVQAQVEPSDNEAMEVLREVMCGARGLRVDCDCVYVQLQSLLWDMEIAYRSPSPALLITAIGVNILLKSHTYTHYTHTHTHIRPHTPSHTILPYQLLVVTGDGWGAGGP
jgi:hypothetical protein